MTLDSNPIYNPVPKQLKDQNDDFETNAYGDGNGGWDIDEY